jgi:thymidylate synthase (FAD)
MTDQGRIQMLDHGYLELIETWGSDQRIIESARMSTDKGFLGWGPHKTDKPCTKCGGSGETDDRGYRTDLGQPYFSTMKCEACDGDGKERKAGDEGLLRFLWEHQHSTPFEVAGLTIEVQAPIFVFREWHRHRVPFGYNELSARYTPLPDVNYVPTLERCMLGSDGKNKQAGTIKSADALTDEAAIDWLNRLEAFYVLAEELYQHGLKIGLPKELARIVVPVGRYSRMRATGNLRGWLAFLKLRTAPDAQWEIRQFANTLGEQIIAKQFPRTWELFAEHKPT